MTSQEHEFSPKPEPRTTGELVSVVKLRSKGRRITGAELEESAPIVGLLKVEEQYQPPGSKMLRHRSMASLDRPDNVMGSVTTPLFEPVIERWTSDSIILSGWEINVEDGNVATQHVQVWLIRRKL